MQFEILNAKARRDKAATKRKEQKSRQKKKDF